MSDLQILAVNVGSALSCEHLCLLNECLYLLSALQGTKASSNTQTLVKRVHWDTHKHTDVLTPVVAPAL